MDDQRVGAAIRAVRIKRGWRQVDLARHATVSRGTISRVERGRVDELTVAALRRVAGALDVRIEVRPWWRAGDLDRLLNAKHSALHEEVARLFGGLPGWVTAPEVSFAIYGERGVIDILAWHAGRRALLVIELKTDIVDVNELLGTLDRKRRLAARIVAERGWRPITVSTWLIVAASRTNEARAAAHRATLDAALPQNGSQMRRWLREPSGTIAARSFWTGAGPRRPPASVELGRPTSKKARPTSVGGRLAARHRVVVTGSRSK